MSSEATTPSSTGSPPTPSPISLPGRCSLAPSKRPEEAPMEIQVRHTPSFAVVRCAMAGGEAVRAEAGAMMATSDGVVVDAKMQGGLMKSLRRSVLGGESLFVTTYTAPSQGGWVDVAANLPGDLHVRRVTQTRAMFLSRGSYLASEGGVEIDTK